MALGTALPARIATSTGTIYYADGASGNTNNGGTSTSVRSTGSDGATTGTNTLTAASASWTSADIGHGIMIDVGGVKNFRKITAVGSGTSLTFSGATITTGSGRTWTVGGSWKEPQDFFDRASSTSVSPVPGDILEVRQWRTSLSSSLSSSATSMSVSSTTGFPASGTQFPLQIDSEGVWSVGTDGRTATSNTLTASSAAWTSSDVDRQVWFETTASWESRLITTVNTSTQVTFDGAAMANDVTTLSAGPNASQTNISLTAWPTTWPTDRTIVIQVDSEKMAITAGLGTTSITVVRAVEGTTGATHSNGATVSWCRCWRVLTVEVVNVTSYSGTTLTVTRGHFSTKACAHANGMSVDAPYQGKRATSLSDTGARHVINTSGTSSGVYTVRNYPQENVYLFPNSNTGQGTQNETIVIRPAVQYWRFVGRYGGGGGLTIERARSGSGNPPNVYYVDGSADCELYGVRIRFSQAGSGVLIEDTTARIHVYNAEACFNDIDLAFNHHGFYNQGVDCVLVQTFSHDHAFGNGIQLRVTCVNPIMSNCVFARNRGTGSGVLTEADTSGARCYNNICINNNRGIRQIGGGTVPGTDADNRAPLNIVNQSLLSNFQNTTASGNQSWKWNTAGNDKTASGPGDNLTSDPLLVNRNGPSPADVKLTTSSPARAFGDDTFCPTFDFDGAARTIVDSGIWSYVLVAPGQIDVTLKP